MTQLQAHPAAGWYVDPSGRHEARYWDGQRWTDRVADRGVENADADAATRSGPAMPAAAAEPEPGPVATMVAEPPVAGGFAAEPPAAAEPNPDPYAALAELRGDDPDTEMWPPEPDEPAEYASELVASYAPESVPGPQAGDPPVVAAAAEELPGPSADASPEPVTARAGAYVEPPSVEEAPDPRAHLFDDVPVDSFTDSPADSPVDSPADSPIEASPMPDSPVDDTVAPDSLDSPVDSPVDSFADSPVFADMTVDAPVDPFSDLPTDAALESWLASPAPMVDSPMVDLPPLVDSAPMVDLPPLVDSAPIVELPPLVESAPIVDAPPPPTMEPPAPPVDLFTPPTLDPPYAAPTMDPPVAATSGPEHGWYPDPMGRAEVRYWDGSRWTERIATNGVERMDTPVADVLDVAAAELSAAETHAPGSVTPTYDADWYPDPTGRHEVRYFDGTTWTEHVANNGLSALDPIADGAPVAGSGAALAASIVPAVSTAASPNATSVEAAEKAFAAALAPAVETPEAEPAPAVIPVRADWAARPNALVGWIVVVGAGVLGIGSVGPWAKASAPVVGDVVQNGMSGDGRFMLALAILLLGTGVGLIMGKLGRVVAFSALSLGTLAAIVCAVDMARISNGSYGLLQGTADATASAGIGLWACLVGAIVCIAGGIVAVTHR